MIEFFLRTVDISISATYLVLAVLLCRLLLKKAPKWVCVLLWGLVAVRLLCPLSVESVLSLLPSGQTVSPQLVTDPTPAITSGISALNSVVNPILSQAASQEANGGVNRLQVWTEVAAWIYASGAVLLLGYTAVTYLRLRGRVKTAVRLGDNIFQSENVAAPFVLGILKPRIYLPFRLDPQAMDYVIAHERAHIRRRDHWWKPLGFMLLALHWFNPFMWLAYILLCRDIELACDEKVVRELGAGQRADYSQALLTCSISRRVIAACPLAFGEVGVKQRVRWVLHYKKPAFWIVLVAVIACIALAVCFLTDPPEKGRQDPAEQTAVRTLEELADSYTLEQAKLDGCVVMENGDVTSGQASWLAFVDAAQRGQSASVRYVTYYTLSDATRYDPEYYQSVKDRYPAMYVHDLSYDGNSYTVRWYEEGTLIQRNYRYLMHYTGKPDSPDAAYSYYSRYVLTNENTVSWEDILRGMASSQLGAAVDHFSVYTDLYYTNETTPAGQLTLRDVVALAEKGMDLTWEDLETYDHITVGNGLYLCRYEIDSAFYLLAGDSESGVTPAYVYLCSAVTGEQVDIRTGDVAAFLEDHQAQILENAITSAILEYNAPQYQDGSIRVESHEILVSEAYANQELQADAITIYAMTMYAAYNPYTYMGKGLEMVSGGMTPAALTFTIDEYGLFSLAEYWEPRPGALYAQDIREKFPENTANNILSGAASGDELAAQCEEKAMEVLKNTLFAGEEPAALLRTVCAAPAQSSNPGDCIEANRDAYEKLLACGEDALRYCFGQFMEGGQTGLPGYIMALACEDIMESWGEAYVIEEGWETGQDWYYRMLSLARELEWQYSDQELQQQYPGAWLLLRLLLVEPYR